MKSNEADEVRFAEAREYWEKKQKKGWRNTCCGFLAPEEIKAAGLKFSNEIVKVFCKKENKFVSMPRGYDAIPGQEYIESVGVEGRPKGTKFWGVSKQFTDWREDYSKRQREIKTVEDKIDDEEKKSETQTRVKILDDEPINKKLKDVFDVDIDVIDVDDIPY